MWCFFYTFWSGWEIWNWLTSSLSPTWVNWIHGILGFSLNQGLGVLGDLEFVYPKNVSRPEWLRKAELHRYFNMQDPSLQYLTAAINTFGTFGGALLSKQSIVICHF
jgi:hypothetical protein